MQRDSADLFLDLAKAPAIHEIRCGEGFRIGVQAPDSNGLLGHIECRGGVIDHALLDRRDHAQAPHPARIQPTGRIRIDELLIYFTAVPDHECVESAIQIAMEQADILRSKSKRHGTRADLGQLPPF